MRLFDLLAGRRLANQESDTRKIGVFEAIPTIGLDALGSSAYGPEAALAILAPLGAASLAWIGWVMAPIVGLLAVLFVSYWQTVRAYPSNGGAYTVAKENLGTTASLLAAAALMLDYVLNVAVGISAGVGALTSAVPALQPYILPLCLGILALLALINLRGTLESGRAVRAADLSVPRLLRGRAGHRAGQGGAGRRAPAAGDRAPCPARHRRGGRTLVAAPRLRRRLHRDDRGRGGQQRHVRVHARPR